MNLAKHYNQLYTKSAKEILAENYKLDTQINSASDSRFGITLLIRPSESVKANIQVLLKDLKALDNTQYYYPDSDIHITVMSIISCYDGFSLDKINVHEYIDIIEKSLIEVDQININFRGVTASPSAVMLQGFPSDETLNNFRNKLRDNFKNSDLQQSIDSRYEIATAHSTIMRFQEKLKNPEKLIQVLEQYRDYDFGEFRVKELELVYNDWYQHDKNTILLADFFI